MSFALLLLLLFYRYEFSRGLTHWLQLTVGPPLPLLPKSQENVNERELLPFCDVERIHFDSGN